MLGRSLADVSQAWWFIPMKNPALITMPLSFVVAIAVSLVTKEDGAEGAFQEMRRRVMFGA